MTVTPHASHGGPQRETGAVRSPARVALYVTMSCIGLIALSLFFFDFFGLSRTPFAPTNSTANLHDLFDGLYQIGWKADGSAGNTSVEAVYYYPALYQALAAYQERSSLQDETLRELNKFPNMSLYPFLVILQRNETIDPAFSLDAHATLLADNSVSYEVDHWQPLSLPDTSGNSMAGIMWFRQPSGAPSRPNVITMTLEGIPGNAKTTQFTWNNAVLSGVNLAAN